MVASILCLMIQRANLVRSAPGAHPQIVALTKTCIVTATRLKEGILIFALLAESPFDGHRDVLGERSSP